MGSLRTRREQSHGNLKMGGPNDSNGAKKIVLPAGVDAETVGFGTQEKRFLARVVVEAKIIAEGIDHHDSTIAPVPHDTVAAAPGDRLRREIRVCIELKQLMMTSLHHPHLPVERRCDDGNPAVFGRAGEKLLVGRECHRSQTTAEAIVHLQISHRVLRDCED